MEHARRPPRAGGELSRETGRWIFGRDPEGYARGRLGYPEEVYRTLREPCGLRPGARVLELGPGTGIATRELLRRGLLRLLAVEADPHMAAHLRESLGPWRGRCRIVVSPFETAPLAEGSFDLLVAATSFHWLDQARAVERAAELLRPGGWLAVWSNLHGDHSRPNAWSRASRPIFEDGRARGPARRTPVAQRASPASYLDLPSALRAHGGFDPIRREVHRWKVDLSTEEAIRLFASFSDLRALPAVTHREKLRRLTVLAEERFHGRVRLAVRTPMVIARRL